MKRITSIFLAMVMVLSAVLGLSCGVSAQTTSTVATLTPSGEHQLYRIPSMVITEENSILIACEARYDLTGDTGAHDIIIMRSRNGGEFKTVLTLEGTDYASPYSLSNPTLIVDNDGNIHLLYVCNTGSSGVFYMRSEREADGLEWSEPVDISVALGRNRIGWSMFNFGATHGICVENGEHRGRLIAPAWCYMSSTVSYDVYTVYSDDNGKTWAMGDKVSDNLNESTIAELSDGSIMVNSRQFGVSYDSTLTGHTRPTGENDAYRRMSVSSDGVSGWSATQVTSLADPACQGSLCSEGVTVNGVNKHALLFTNCNNKTKRQNLTLRCSFDDGKTWEKQVELETSDGGYSDVAIDNGGKIYVVYENSVGRYLTVKCVDGWFDRDAGNTDTFKFYNQYQLSNDGSSKIRFVRELKCDVETLEEIGFEVTAQYGGETVYKKLKCNSVYTSLLADGKPCEAGVGTYFLAHGISELPTDNIICFTYRPYVIYKDGTSEFGEWECVNVRSGNDCGTSATDSKDCVYRSWESLFGE